MNTKFNWELYKAIEGRGEWEEGGEEGGEWGRGESGGEGEEGEGARGVIFSIQSVYICRGRGYLKAYRCIQGGGGSKFSVFIVYIHLWMGPYKE